MNYAISLLVMLQKLVPNFFDKKIWALLWKLATLQLTQKNKTLKNTLPIRIQ